MQSCGTEKEIGSGLVGAVYVNSVSGALMKNRNGAYVEGGGSKRAGFGRPGDGFFQQTERSDGPKARLNGSENFGPLSNRSKSPIGQREDSGLIMALILKQIHRPIVGTVRSGGLKGPVSNGPKMVGPQTGPCLLKVGVRGLRGMEKVLNVARVSKGVTYVSKAEKRLGDRDSRLGVVSSLDSPADPAWICARDPLLNAQEDKTCLRGTSGFESWWEKGLGAGSSICPLMGFLHQGQGEEGCPAARSFALVEASCSEEDDPEALRILAKGSRFETASSNDFSPSIFSVFGRPLLSGGSSGLGESHEHEDMGEMKPLRLVLADGREWGKGLAVVPMEGGQTAVGLGSLSEEPTVVNSEFKGYNTWEDSCLIKFSEFLGVTTAGFEEEILELLRKMDVRQHGDKRKGDPAETRCERELRKLECTINFNGKGQIRGGRDGEFLAKVEMKLKLFSWNVRGANNLNKRNVIRNFIRSQRVDLVCLQETKLQNLSSADARSFGVGILVEADWRVVEAKGSAGGILVFWDTRKLELVEAELGHFLATCMFKNVEDGFLWAFTGVYGPVKRCKRELFWEELGAVKGLWEGP